MARVLAQASTPIAYTNYGDVLADIDPVLFAFIGCGLATFVTSQVWCTQMYSKSVVGLANATAGGWGNLGERTPQRHHVRRGSR